MAVRRVIEARLSINSHQSHTHSVLALSSWIWNHFLNLPMSLNIRSETITNLTILSFLQLEF